MTKVSAVIAFMLFASAARGEAIHDDPATSDNVRIYALINAPMVTFVLDGGAPSRFAGMSVNFTRLRPGRHTASIILPDGDQTSLTFDLLNDDMVESKGRRWWCLMAGPRDGQLTMLQPTAAQCKKVTDAGPN